VLTSGNTAVNNIILTGNLSANNAALLTSTISTSLTLLGTVKDGLSSVGTNNQVLSSNVTGVRWINLPVYSATSPLLYNSGTGVFSIQQANASQNGYLSSADWITFDGKQTAISLTTTGNSGASTLVGSTINVPNYTLSGLGGVPQTRTLTINGVTYNLSADRTWTLATGVSSVSATTPLFSTGGVNPDISIQKADSALDGYLSSADWLTFNSKQPAGNYITSLTGEATGAGPGATAVTLSTTAVTGKLLTGLNLAAGGTISATDSILIAFGKTQNQISALVGGVIFKGTWNASTNTPTLVSSVGVQGNYYIVSVAGNTNLNGITDWQVGDWAIFNGTVWDKVDNTDAVSSVNGFTGAVNLTTDNIPEGSTNLYYTNTRARTALSFVAGSGAYNNTTGVITIPTNNNQITNGSNYITLASLSAVSPLSYINTTGVFSISQSTTSTDGYLSSIDWNTFNNKQATITLTTTGTSGAATFVSNTLNIPQYQSVLTNPITGTGTSGQVAYFNGTSSLTSSATFAFTPTSQLLVNNSVTAASAIARGTNLTPTLTAAANGDVLVGLDINPTFNVGAFTGYLQYGLRVRANTNQLNTNDYVAIFENTNAVYGNGIRIIGGGDKSAIRLLLSTANNDGTDVFRVRANGSISVGTGNNNNNGTIIDNNSISLGGYQTIANSGSVGIVFSPFSAANAVTFRQSGNVLIGTTTDAGFRLDVNGTARVQSFTTINAAPAVNGSAALLVQSTTNNSVSALLYGIDNNSTITTINSSSSYIGINSRNAIGASLVQATSVQGALNISAGTTTAAIGYSVNSAVIGTGAATLFIGYNFENVFTSGSGAVTRQIGIRINNLTTGSAANVGILFNNSAGTSVNGTWDIYAQSGNNSYFAGSLGIGTTSLAGITLNIAKNLTGATASTQVFAQPTIQSDVTGTAIIYNAFPSTQAAAFTINNLYYYQANQATIGAASAINTQVGFRVASSLTGATNNFAFRSELAAATNVWNLYMGGTANNYFAGSLGIGTTSVDTTMLRISRAFTSTLATSIFLDSQVSSTNASANYIVTSANTEAATFTTQIRHISLTQGTFGAGSTVTSQFGIIVGDLTGATNNYGFFGNISAATNRWNLYMGGTANNFMAGSLGIGATSLVGRSLSVTKNITGAVTSYGIISNGQIQSDATSSVRLFNSVANTVAASFTLSSLVHYYTEQVTFGAGSTVTNQYGFYAESNLTGATNNYGFFGNIPSGTNRWNLYMAGTANNYLAGSLGIGSTSFGAKLQVNNAATVGTGSTAMSAINPIIFVDNGNAANGSIVIKSHSVGAGNVVGALRFASSPDGANYNYAGIEALSSASSVVETLSFKIPSSNGAAATSNEIARIDINGLLIGTQTTIVGTSLVVGKMTGSTVSRGILSSGTIQSNVTSQARYFNSAASTAAASFTLTSLFHYYAEQGTIGAGSVVTNQYGYVAESNLTGATNNYGFFGSIPSGTNRWNLYMAGTAANYMAGVLNIGTTTLSGYTLDVNGTARVQGVITGSVSGGTLTLGTASTNTTAISISGFFQNTGAISITNSNSRGFTNEINLQGNGYITRYNGNSSSVTEGNTYYGAFGNINITAGTIDMNGFYFFPTIVSETGATIKAFNSGLSAASNRWNLYMQGTAANYMAGQVAIGSTTLNASAALQVTSTTQGFLPPRMTTTQRTAIATPATGLIVYQTDGVEGLWLNTSTGWRELTVV
jgi:hypothetical protein